MLVNPFSARSHSRAKVMSSTPTLILILHIANPAHGKSDPGGICTSSNRDLPASRPVGGGSGAGFAEWVRHARKCSTEYRTIIHNHGYFVHPQDRAKLHDMSQCCHHTPTHPPSCLLSSMPYHNPSMIASKMISYSKTSVGRSKNTFLVNYLCMLGTTLC